MSRSNRRPVIVIGAGTTAYLAAQRMARHWETLQIVWGGSIEVPLLTQSAGQSGPVLAGPDWTRIKAAAIYDWSGQVGDFKLKIQEPSGTFRRLSGVAVILALDGPTARPSCLQSLPGEPLPAFAREIGVSLFGPLKQPEPEKTKTILFKRPVPERIENPRLKRSEPEGTENPLLIRQKPELTENPRPTGSSSITLLLGRSGMEASLSTALVLKSALKLRIELNTTVQVLYPELTVAAGELDKLYQEARDAGVRFYRYPASEPPQVREEAGMKTLVFSDPLLPPGFPPLEIGIDRLVIAEEYLPAPEIKHLAELAGLAVSGEGFLEAEELPYWAGRTNRRGIYALGLLRGPTRVLDLLEELAAVEVDLNDCLNNHRPNPAAQVDPQLCAICLTCYRVCPHRAVELIYAPGPMPQNKLNQLVAWIHPQACQACGTCIVECPAQAIRWADTVESGLPLDQELLLGQNRLYRIPAAVVLTTDVSAADVNKMNKKMAEHGEHAGNRERAERGEHAEHEDYDAAELSEPLNPATAGRPVKKKALSSVRLVALACVNSGYLAFQNLASTLSVFDPKGLTDQADAAVEILARIKVQAVPCAGSVDVLTVLNLLAEGYDGVLICACYKEACLHGNGPKRALKRWPVTQNYLEMLGWSNRVALVSLAGPNPNHLAGSLRQLALNIRGLGGGMVDNC